MKAVLQWVLRTMMKAKGETGIVQTMPKRNIVEINTQITAQRLMENGIDPMSLKNANQVENAIIAIENKQKANLAENIRGGIGNTKTAKVFDLKGRQIKNTDNIMGGEELPPPGSRGGPDDIAAPIQSSEETMKNMIESELMKSENPFSDLVKTTKQGPKTIKEREAEILASMEKSNKETVQRIKNRKMLDNAIDNASPGFVKGDRKYNAQLVADDLAEKKFGKDFYDLDQRQQMDLYGEALDGLDDSKKFAQGGRAGFSNGSGGLLELLNMTPKERKRVGMKQLADKISQFVNVEGEGSKSGKQQIQGAPEGFTMDNETYNFILNADIPINKKINFLTTYGREKGRGKVEKDDQELFVGEGGSRKREIGLDINPDAEKGFGGNIMYDPDRNNVTGGITYKYADGGRIGFKDGMTRRTFLKLLGGVAAVPIVGKLFKLAKVGKTIKKVPMIKTDNVPGKPEWFDALVNKVIAEGDDVTKKFATQEREIVHTKKINDTDEVTVYQDLNTDSVRVEYNSPNNMMEETVDLSYKRTPPDEGAPQASSDFEVTESGFVGRADGPDDYFIDAEPVGGSSIKSLESDVSALKEYATGQKQTLKEFVQSKKRKDKVKKLNEGDLDAQSEYIVNRQGDYDPSDYDDYASGGIARLLGE